MILQILSFVIVAGLGVEAWSILKSARATVKTFAAESADIFKLQLQMLAAHREALQTLLLAHGNATKAVVATHTEHLQSITTSHGAAAEQLSAAVTAHNDAAAIMRDGVAEMRRAGETLNTLVNNSQMSTVVQLLEALKKFWIRS